MKASNLKDKEIELDNDVYSIYILDKDEDCEIILA